MNQRTCPTCATTFAPTHSRNIYCRVECRRDEHAKVAKNCDCCGARCMKAPTTRYKATYCSLLCRNYSTWGPASTKLPANHWARWYGRMSQWTPPVIRNTGECAWCGTHNPRGTSAAYCTTDCKERAKRQRRRAAQFNATGEYTFRELMVQYRRQGYTCAYCGTKPSELPDAEHVVPLSKGGRNDMTNIVAACRTCNSDKRDLLLADWNTDRQRRGLPFVNIKLQGPAFLHLVA